MHPTFLYELIWNLLVAAVIVWADRKFKLGHGRVFALYVAGYTLGRGWIEMMRTDTANHILGLRVNVWTSILLFLAAVIYYVMAGKKGPREAPETLSSKTAPAEPETSEEAAETEPEKAEEDAREPEHAEVTADAGAADTPADEPEKPETKDS